MQDSQGKETKSWCEVANTSTDADNILVKKDGDLPPFLKFYKENPKFAKSLHTCEEMCSVADVDGKKTRSKLDPRQRLCMMLGYIHKHATGVYQFLHARTNKAILSRDVQWIGKHGVNFTTLKQTH